jgi:predicted RNA-binding Zn ribbon-like protein
MLISAVPEDLCLAFANTQCWRGSEAPTEALGDIAALLAWAAKPLPGEVAAELEAWASNRQGKAARLFAEAIGLREAIYRMFAALAAGDAAPAKDFAALNDALAEAPARHRLGRARSGYAWEIERGDPSAAGLLAPVLWSAADLLVKGNSRRVRQCANEQCLWLFLDESKNGTRRWCDMTSCGNRAKARRHYLKSKQG